MKATRSRCAWAADPTICSALMQAVGMVNDHATTCPRIAELGGRVPLERR